MFVDEHKLQWNGVTLENYSETNEAIYVVYAFDSVANDWIKLAETNATFLDVENTNGLLKPEHIALAVATKGNSTSSGLNSFVTGNMSEKSTSLSLAQQVIFKLLKEISLGELLQMQ